MIFTPKNNFRERITARTSRRYLLPDQAPPPPPLRRGLGPLENDFVPNSENMNEKITSTKMTTERYSYNSSRFTARPFHIYYIPIPSDKCQIHVSLSFTIFIGRYEGKETKKKKKKKKKRKKYFTSCHSAYHINYVVHYICTCAASIVLVVWRLTRGVSYYLST